MWYNHPLFCCLILIAHSINAKKCDVPYNNNVREALQQCAFKLTNVASYMCVQICLLEQFNVIVKGEVRNENWKNWLSQAYPVHLIDEIDIALRKCAKLYDPVQRNSYCDENQDFYGCIEDTIDKICEQ